MIHREDDEQKALIQWADVCPMPAGMSLHRGAKIGDYLFAIPNGGYRRPREASRLVGLGVRAGVSDLFFAFPSPDVPIKHGLFIEMKAPKPYGRAPSKKQDQFAFKMREAGYKTALCYGWDGARLAIMDYLRC